MDADKDEPSPPIGLMESASLYRHGIVLLAIALVAVYSYEVWLFRKLDILEPASLARMAHALPEKPSLAVLPFENMSDDGAQNYFADGMTDDLIGDLSKVPGLFVIARDTMFTYNNKTVPVRQVAEDLGVRFVIKGQVDRTGDDLVLQFQLIDALRGKKLLVERYAGRLNDALRLRAQVSGDIISELIVGSVPDLKMRPTALGHRIQSGVYQRAGQPDLAMEALNKALAADPNHPDGYRAKAFALVLLGQPDLALANLETAARLDPGNLAPNNLARAMAYFFLRRTKEAAGFLLKSLAAKPDSTLIHGYLLAAYGHLGRTADARAALAKLDQYRDADGGAAYTIDHAMSHYRLHRPEDRDYFRQGLELAGVPAGGYPNAAGPAVYTILSRGSDGHFNVKGAQRITAAQANELSKNGVVFIDMGDRAGWNSGHIKGALHGGRKIGEMTKDNFATVITKDQPVAFYCSRLTCQQSAHAAAKAVAWGYGRVYHFAGGIEEWIKAGLPLVKGD